jgi:hypothetical protein
LEFDIPTSNYLHIMSAVETPPKTPIPPEAEKHDPVTGAPHYHPVASGTGAAAGATLGAVAGAVAGPIGAAVGAAVGGVIGGLVGKSAAEGYDEGYWRTVYPTEPYYSPARAFEDYNPAYRYGEESWLAHRGKSFDEIQDQLAKDWDKNRRGSKLTWDEAKIAAKRAYHRVASPGDGDDDNGVPG